MNTIEPLIPKIVTIELKAANLDNPPFRSMHEGYAVILEEMDEVNEALGWVKMYLDDIWWHIKENRPGMVFNYAEEMEKRAVHLAAEVIQVAAMARKLQNSLEGEYEQSTDTHAGNSGL